MNPTKEQCQYIIKKGSKEGCQCKVKKNITNGWCFSHNPINQKVNIKYSNIENKENIKIDIKNIMKKFGVDFIEMRNVINLLEEEEEEEQEVEEEEEEEEKKGFKIIENLELIIKPKTKTKKEKTKKEVVEVVVEKTKNEQVDELVEEKLQLVFKKYFYENGCDVKKTFEEVDREESNDDMKIYDDKHYKNFELVLCKLYKIKYRNNITLFNTIKSYIDREYFHHMWCEDEGFLKHSMFDKLMGRDDENQYIIED
jgi:hypothetical protein